MADQANPDKKILFDVHFLKNSDFRTSFASGVFGGLTPQGLINCNFYIDRAPLPNRITYQVTPPHAQLNRENEFEREGKKGIIREVPFGIIIDVNALRQ